MGVDCYWLSSLCACLSGLSFGSDTNEIELANEQVVQARAGMGELERVVANLKTELDASNRARTQLQSDLDEAHSEIEKKQSEVERLSTELEKATNPAKDAEAPDQKGDSASEPSDAWQPQ